MESSLTTEWPGNYSFDTTKANEVTMDTMEAKHTVEHIHCSDKKDRNQILYSHDRLSFVIYGLLTALGFVMCIIICTEVFLHMTQRKKDDKLRCIRDQSFPIETTDPVGSNSSRSDLQNPKQHTSAPLVVALPPSVPPRISIASSERGATGGHFNAGPVTTNPLSKMMGSGIIEPKGVTKIYIHEMDAPGERLLHKSDEETMYAD